MPLPSEPTLSRPRVIQRRLFLAAAAFMPAACAMPPPPRILEPSGFAPTPPAPVSPLGEVPTPVARPAISPPATISVPQGGFISGSDRAERDRAYDLDELAYGQKLSRTRRQYENEDERSERSTGAYRICRTPITNAQYTRFVIETGHRFPAFEASQGFIHAAADPLADASQRAAWTGPVPPRGREDHPVVLVSQDDARAFADWLSLRTGDVWRLPHELEWEKAARGDDGRPFPWGEIFDASRLDSADSGPLDTQPVGLYKRGASPYGMLDAAGQVYEWTGDAGLEAGTIVVKGAGSWNDRGCGACRPAWRQERPADLRDPRIGFRLVRL